MDEEHFHDLWALSVAPESVNLKAAWGSTSSPETEWIMSQLGDLKGRRILELGTGVGEGAASLALLGADVTATDVSREMLNLAEKVAKLNGAEIQTSQVSAEDLSQFEAETFDIVYGANVLHHVDIAKCLGEIQRVLKPGGLMAVWDPVKYNPIINVYRHFAHGVRTDDEHPLGRKEIRMIKDQFGDIQTCFFWLSATGIFLRYFFVDRISPSAGRYWRIVLDRYQEHENFLRRAHQVDSRIFQAIPPTKWLAWNVAVVAKKFG